MTIIQNPTQFKIPTWFLNRQRDIVDGKNFQVLSNGVDSKLRDDLERLKKIRAHRGLRHSWGLRVRGQHTKTTGAFLIFSSAISRSDQVSLFRPSWKDCRCVEEARLDSILLGKGWFPVDPVFVLHTLCYAFHYVHDSVSTGGNAYIFATPLIKDSGEDRTAQGEVGRMSRDGPRPANVDSRRFMPPTAYIIYHPPNTVLSCIYSMSATWASSPSHHPWFKMSSLKRKLSSDGDTSNEDDSRDSLSTLHHHKRRRSTTLERDLASLSLSNVRHGVASSPVTSLANYQRSESPLSDTFMDTDVSPSRETPMSAVSTEEAIPEVKMSSSSWYELEKDRKPRMFPHI